MKNHNIVLVGKNLVQFQNTSVLVIKKNQTIYDLSHLTIECLIRGNDINPFPVLT